MRALHVVKTSDGAQWAARQARVLVKLGVEVHVALPRLHGEALSYWEDAGASLHCLDCSLPVGAPHQYPRRAGAIRRLVADIQPDLIHSHFVTTTIMLRLALGQRHKIPRLFQVPGPLHLEHGFYRRAEIAAANDLDYWIPSSRYIKELYLKSGVERGRIYLSYYGTTFTEPEATEDTSLRDRFRIPDSSTVVGNVSYMYPPKRYLGQATGLKGHELIIDALGIIAEERDDVIGILVGGQWGGGTAYEERLRRHAREVAGKQIHFTGRLSQAGVNIIWRDLDMVVHVPTSENCGGVVEPLAHGLPVIASNTGGLPEVAIDGATGWVVFERSAPLLVRCIKNVLAEPEEALRRAANGKRLVQRMFDVERTGAEVFEIYSHIIGQRPDRPLEFDSMKHVAHLFRQP